MNVEILLVQYYVFGDNKDLITFENINKFISSDNKNKQNNKKVLTNKTFNNNSYESIYNNLTPEKRNLLMK